MVDLRQTKEYARYLESLGWIVEKAGKNFVYIRRLPLTPFSIIKVQRPEKIPFKKIDHLAKKYRALAIYLELSTINYPFRRNLARRASSTINHGYRPSQSPFLPTKTSQLDLTQSKEKILAQMKKETRYSLRKVRGTIIKKLSNKEIEGFHQAWKKAVGWRRHVPSLKNLQALKRAFGKKAIFLTGNCLAGTVILLANQTAYYFYAFTSKEGREKSAQYLLVWKAIRLAKKQGCKIFDFEGIYDRRFPQKSWHGFSHFKKGFGGKEVEYPGCFRKYNLHF